jgi:hypothetical protein
MAGPLGGTSLGDKAVAVFDASIIAFDLYPKRDIFKPLITAYSPARSDLLLSE